MSKNSFQDILNKQRQETLQKEEQGDTKFNPYSESVTSDSHGFRSLLNRKKIQQDPKRAMTLSFKHSTINKIDELTKMLEFPSKSELISELIDIAYVDLKGE